MTPALRALDEAGIPHELLTYRYEDRGGTAVAARETGEDEHHIIKTLVFEDEQRQPCVVLMHGDCQVSAKQLARELGCRRLQPCAPAQALRHTGYQVGGISPFGLAQPLPILMESTIAGLDRVVINAGRRGLLVALAAADVIALLHPRPVEVALPRKP